MVSRKTGFFHFLKYFCVQLNNHYISAKYGYFTEKNVTRLISIKVVW